MFKIAGDPRSTRVGQFPRRYALDEYPQLVNVLRGEMSLVGPRPLIQEEDREVEGWGRRRLALKPGMTGLWQASGSSKIGLSEMVDLDYSTPRAGRCGVISRCFSGRFPSCPRLERHRLEA